MNYHRLLIGLACLFVFNASGCGSHAKGKSDSTSLDSTKTSSTVGRNSDGTPDDGSGGSTDPHPAACTSCTPDHVNTVGPNDANNLNPRNLSCDPTSTTGTQATCEGFCFVDPNVTPVWANEPPSSGPAYPTPSYGFGLQQTVIPRGTWVHNLAHGYVVLTYNCPQGCDAEVQNLAQVYNDLAGQTILITADPELKGSQFAAIAFNYVMTFDTVNIDQLECFVMTHVGHGYPHGDYVPPAQ